MSSNNVWSYNEPHSLMIITAFLFLGTTDFKQYFEQYCCKHLFAFLLYDVNANDVWNCCVFFFK